MTRKASREEVRVRVRDTGGSKRRGGRGWDDSSHLSVRYIPAKVSR
jgi:hypothetical protein